MVTELFKVAISARVLRRVGPTLSDPTKEKLMQHILNERYNKAISQIPGGVQEASIPLYDNNYSGGIPPIWGHLVKSDIRMPYFRKPSNWKEFLLHPFRFFGAFPVKKHIIMRPDLVAYKNIVEDVANNIPLEKSIAKHIGSLHPLYDISFVLSRLPKTPQHAKNLLNNLYEYGGFGENLKSFPLNDAIAKLHEAREAGGWELIAKLMGKPTSTIGRYHYINTWAQSNPYTRRLLNLISKFSPTLRTINKTIFATHAAPTLLFEQRDLKKIMPLLPTPVTPTNPKLPGFLRFLFGYRGNYPPFFAKKQFPLLLKRISQMKPEYIQQLSPKIKTMVESFSKNPDLINEPFDYLKAPSFTDLGIYFIIPQKRGV